MRTLQTILVVLTFVSGVILFHGEAPAMKEMKLWSNRCANCHNGETAPDADWMREKYSTLDEFVAAVRGKGNKCMNILKKDETLIYRVAEELGIK